MQFVVSRRMLGVFLRFLPLSLYFAAPVRCFDTSRVVWRRCSTFFCSFFFFLNKKKNLKPRACAGLEWTFIPTRLRWQSNSIQETIDLNFEQSGRRAPPLPPANCALRVVCMEPASVRPWLGKIRERRSRIKKERNKEKKRTTTKTKRV